MSHKADGEKVENRPKCDWPVTTADGGKTETNPCGSEERIYQVSTPDVDYWGHKSTSERNVCQRHLGDAWNGPATEAHPLDVVGK